MPMAVFTRVIGKKASSTALVNIQMPMAMFTRVIGKMSKARQMEEVTFADGSVYLR